MCSKLLRQVRRLQYGSCNYGVNKEYEKQFQVGGLRVSARGVQGETRAVGLPVHRRFFHLGPNHILVPLLTVRQTCGKLVVYTARFLRCVCHPFDCSRSAEESAGPFESCPQLRTLVSENIF
jgi:hypothetical protein